MARYLSKIAPPDENGCRLWTAGTDKDGYGKFQTGSNGRQQHWRAHRYGYAHLIGPIGKGLVVCHSCDTPLCQTPEHWWLGTPLDNDRDRAAKGRARGARGERSGHAKLTEADVRTMRAEHAAGGVSMRALGRRYGVTQETARLAINGTNWSYIA